MTDTRLWISILVLSAGAYAFKLLGQSLPARMLASPRAERVVYLVPLSLLAALAAVLTFGSAARSLDIDGRAAGMVAAVVLLLVRAPFLVVVAGAAVTAALLRSFT